MKNLSSLSKEEQKIFFSSFDQVLTDVDGVLWHLENDITGARDAINLFKQLGKRVIFVSNNCTKSHKVYCQQLNNAGYDVTPTDLVLPVLAMISYLKEIKFTKVIYLLGMTPLRNSLQEAGFKVAERLPNVELETTAQYLRLSIEEDDKIGAVIVDLDFGLTTLQLQKAVTFLKKPDVVFISGGSERTLTLGSGLDVIGPGCFHRIIEDMTQRRPIRLAKPSQDFNNYIKETYEIEDAGRVLFIGDSVEADMAFATNCGYQKLLVLSGSTSKDEIDDWKFPEEYKPQYYAESLKVVKDIFQASYS